MPRRSRSSKLRMGAGSASHWDLELKLGPITPDLCADLPAAVEMLQRAWEFRRPAILDEYLSVHPGSRPWAWWEFDADEDRPRYGTAEVTRLLELGELSEDEQLDVLAAADRRLGEYPAVWMPGSPLATDDIVCANAVRAFRGLPLLTEQTFEELRG